MKRKILLIGFCIAYFFPVSLDASQESLVEMKVKRVMLDTSAGTPTAVVILENAKEKKLMPIWIGSEEATSIAIEMEKVTIPRPNTHDLIRNILQSVGAVLNRITITDVRDNVYYATITLRLKGQEFQIDSRPSDAIAVALRMKAPIFVSQQVLAKARELPSVEKPGDNIKKIHGLHLQDLTPQLASLFDMQENSGVLVADVEPKSPASQAGIQRGDIILKANERTVHKSGDLVAILQNAKKTARVKLELLRKGKTVSTVMELPGS